MKNISIILNLIFRTIYNKYSKDLFQKLVSNVLIDNNEQLYKIIPVRKVEVKFTEITTDKILIITNSKIIELSSENIDNAKINIIAFTKMKKIEIKTSKDMIQIYLENDIQYSYFSIYSMFLLKNIVYFHSKESLLDLIVIKD